MSPLRGSRFLPRFLSQRLRAGLTRWRRSAARICNDLSQRVLAPRCGSTHFPMQNEEKILAKTSSLVMAPVRVARAVEAV